MRAKVLRGVEQAGLKVLHDLMVRDHYTQDAIQALILTDPEKLNTLFMAALNKELDTVK